MLELGDLLMTHGDIEGAQKVNEKVLEVDPNSWQAYLQLGVCYALQKERKMAIESTEKALAINQNAPDILNNLGLFYYHDMQIEKALTTLRKALSIKPTHLGALRNVKMILDDSEALAQAGLKRQDLE